MKEIVIDGVTYVLTPKEEKKLPKSWKELGSINGWYTDDNSEVIFQNDGLCDFGTHKNIFATKEQAEASIALAQLSQLLKVYNGDWKPNWSNGEDKHCIFFSENEIIVGVNFTYKQFLAFPREDLRNHFCEHHRELIEKAKPLL